MTVEATNAAADRPSLDAPARVASSPSPSAAAPSIAIATPSLLTNVAARLRKRWLITIIGAAFCLFGAVAANQLWHTGYISNDAAYFAHAHTLTGDGYLPYRDYFVIHPPVLYWLAGGFTWLFGLPAGTWIFGSLVTLALMSSAAWLAVSAVGRDFDSDPVEPDATRWLRYAVAAAVAAALAAGWGRVIGFIPSGAREKFLAVALLMIGTGALARRRYAATGVLFALACWTWQVAVFQTLGVILVWLCVMLARGRRRAWLALLVTIAAGAAVSAACVIVLVALGIFDDFVRQAIEFPMHYAIDPWEAPGRELVKPTGFRRLLIPVDMGWALLPHVLTSAAALGVLATLFVLFKERNQRRSEITRDFRWGIFALFIASYIQILFVSHGPGYAVPLLAPAGAMAGWVIGSFVSVRSRSKWAISAMAAIGAVAIVVRTARPNSFPKLADQQAAAAPIIDVLHDTDGGGEGEGEALIVGDPVLRALIGGYPHEFDMQWIYGRIEAVREELPGGEEEFARRILSVEPEIVYISSRAGEFESVLLERMAGDYEPLESVAWDERPVYRRLPRTTTK